MNPKLRPSGTKRLKLKCDILLSTSAFKFNLRRYAQPAAAALSSPASTSPVSSAKPGESMVHPYTRGSVSLPAVGRRKLRFRCRRRSCR